MNGNVMGHAMYRNLKYKHCILKYNVQVILILISLFIALHLEKKDGGSCDTEICNPTYFQRGKSVFLLMHYSKELLVHCAFFDQIQKIKVNKEYYLNLFKKSWTIHFS